MNSSRNSNSNSSSSSSNSNSNRGEMMSSLLSSMGCSWNTNEIKSPDAKSMSSSISIERIPAHKVSHPSFSLTKNNQEEQEDEEEKDDDSNSSSHRREAVQSKASKLMSRKCVYSQYKDVDNGQQAQAPQAPQRIMLENILDSFDQLVDARIRAYAQILSNHVQVLSESNNTRGARIAEYKLQTLLEFATNNLLFDSISTEFKTSATEDGVCGDISVSTTTSSTATKEEKCISLPIELTVEIRSPRFFHEGLEAVNRGDAVSSPNPRHQGKLTFQANGKVRGDRLFIGQSQNISNDTGRCLTPGAEVCRNSKNLHHVPSDSFFENIEIEIDCNVLLSQMMEEASKVVAMAVELTNLTWTNNTQKQEEINKMDINDMMVENTQNTANIIVDDDDSSTAGECLPQTMTGKRSRCEDHLDTHTHAGTTMSKQVSEVSFCPHVQVVCDEEYIEEPQVSNADASSTSAATITNIHVLDQDEERKTRYFVSDPSYESSESGSDHERTECYQDEKCPPHHHANGDGDECYSKISAERACHIVDFVLAGDIIPCPFSSNKKLRTK